NKSNIVITFQYLSKTLLKGDHNVGFIIGLSYELPFGLSISGRYVYGISDVIETQANSFYFIENKNRNITMEATIAYAIPFYGSAY
ncbi:MAG: hypothetical protein AAFO82_02115, partial [Bacteroidota bacterium]